jgi:hypothetical protein
MTVSAGRTSSSLATETSLALAMTRHPVRLQPKPRRERPFSPETRDFQPLSVITEDLVAACNLTTVYSMLIHRELGNLKHLASLAPKGGARGFRQPIVRQRSGASSEPGKAPLRLVAPGHVHSPGNLGRTACQFRFFGLVSTRRLPTWEARFSPVLVNRKSTPSDGFRRLSQSPAGGNPTAVRPHQGAGRDMRPFFSGSLSPPRPQ